MTTQKPEVEIIKHSTYLNQPSNDELVTVCVKNPKFLDAEFEKHRMLSSNSSSDRAVPFSKILKREPYLPLDVRTNDRGMQSETKLDEESLEYFYNDLTYLHREIVSILEQWKDQVHKQHLNRYLLPFSFQYKVLTGTVQQWRYFLKLRNRSDVDPNFQIIAKELEKEIAKSAPNNINNSWHLPFITQEEQNDNELPLKTLIEMSIARCARVSYENHYGKRPSVEEDRDLAHILLERPYESTHKGVSVDINDPIHATTSEHQAVPMPSIDLDNVSIRQLDQVLPVGITSVTRDGELWSGNLRNWIQFRKLVEHYGNLSNSKI